MTPDQIDAKNAADPRCFSCGASATHRSKRITPAGYHAYQCDRHTPVRPAPLWGSDPGWQTIYEPLPHHAS